MKQKTLNLITLVNITLNILINTVGSFKYAQLGISMFADFRIFKFSGLHFLKTVIRM